MVREIVRVNQRVYNEMKAEDPGFYRGNPASKLANKRELVGYVPMEKRVTSLMAAGLRTAAVRDQEYFDTINDDGNIPPIPPLPRHMPADPAYRDWETDRKSTRLNSSHITRSRMPSSA